MKISGRARAVHPSATLAMAARARSMRAEGHDVLSFSAGEPDFDTPQTIKDAALDALQRGETKYSPVNGTTHLRRAVATWATRRYGFDFDYENVIVSAGAKQVVFNACTALLDPGDEAIVFSPYWVSYPDMISFCGAKTVIVESQASRNFLPELSDFEDALSERTRLVILNSPNNPCGVNYPRALLEGIATRLRRFPEVTVITDDIYGELIYDDEFHTILHPAPDLLDRTLIVYGISKTYAMTGWRVGFGIGAPLLVQAMSRIQGASTSGACSISQAAAEQALNGPQDEVERMRETFRARRDRMVEGLRSLEHVRVVPPGGAFYVFPDVSAYFGDRVKNSFELAEHLLNTQYIATVPGGAFGEDTCIRLSFVCSDDTIDHGITRLKKGLADLR